MIWNAHVQNMDFLSVLGLDEGARMKVVVRDPLLRPLQDALDSFE